MGHKEPLCQVTEHREEDKGLEGCDMTNMRGFCGASGGMALQPGVTDTADLYHTSEQITAEESRPTSTRMKYGHATDEIRFQNPHKQRYSDMNKGRI